MGCPDQNYRYWVIWRCPSVRFFDYQKVKDVERRRATELFGTTDEPSALASKVSPEPICRRAKAPAVYLLPLLRISLSTRGYFLALLHPGILH